MSADRRGVWGALAAYLLWGLLPVYWKALHTVPAIQILAHRVVWSFAFLALLVIVLRQGRVVAGALRQRKVLTFYFGAALLLGFNWFLYIWAVNDERVVETSLGYYINPLVSVVLGVLLLKEKLRRFQWVAVTIAAVGVFYLTWQYGGFPWVAVSLAASFGCYGLVKKIAPLPALPGLAFETAMLFPPALGYLLYLDHAAAGAFGQLQRRLDLLLVLTGVVTALPLLLFSGAAQRVRLSTLGLLQYVSPTCGLVLGVFMFGEPFPPARAFGFGVIWLALGLYWGEGLRHTRRLRMAPGRDGSV